MGYMAGGPHLLSDWFSQSELGITAMGLDVFDVQRRSAIDHGKSGAAGLGSPGEFYDQASRSWFTEERVGGRA